MVEIEWEEPPPPIAGQASSGRGRWEDVFEELRKHPGKWAKIAENVSDSLVGRINQGKAKGCEPGEFEAVSRSTGRMDGRSTVYARYVKGEIEND